MSKDRERGLLEAHKLLTELHDELEAEHKRKRSSLGLPRTRHHEIMGASRALKELGRRIVEAAKVPADSAGS